VNLDVGRPTRPGEYEPADEAYAALLEKLDEHDFADVTPALRRDVLHFYGDASGRGLPDDQDDAQKLRRALARLRASGRHVARNAAS
jgi:hypothetical protein